MPESKKKKKTCQYEFIDYKCKQKLHDKEHCIFHSLDKKGKIEKFRKDFWEEFDRQKKEEVEYNFTGFVFPEDISFQGKKFEKDVNFSDAQFSGQADFRDAQFSGEADFRDAQFSGEAYFRDAQFSGEANFILAQFSGEAYFRDAQFSGEASFRYAQFSGVAGFSYAQFSGVADFSEAQFSGVANFIQAQFSGGAYFEEAQFYGMANFWGAQFSGEAHFKEAQFSGEARFGEAQFSGEARFGEAQFSGMANFLQAQFSGEAHFDGTKFLKLADFKGIKIEKSNSFKMPDTYLYDVKGLFESINKYKDKFAYSNKTEFLPDGFNLFLGEKAAARYPIFSRNIKDDMYLLRFKEKFPKLHFLWWLFADCGRSLWRWALWSLIFGVVFALIYEIIYFCSPATFKADFISPTWSGISFLYYSIVTFTTLGFGDIVPKSPWVQLLVTLEVIMGYVMLGGLISIFANKLARRS